MWKLKIEMRLDFYIPWSISDARWDFSIVDPNSNL